MGKEFKASFLWFIAFIISAVVTYLLPGDNGEEAFVDFMGIFISLSYFCLGWAFLIRAMTVKWK